VIDTSLNFMLRMQTFGYPKKVVDKPVNSGADQLPALYNMNRVPFLLESCSNVQNHV